jgi:hypothetical protein
METTASVKQALLDKQKELIASASSLKDIAYITKAIADAQKIIDSSGLAVLDLNTPYGVMYDPDNEEYFSLGHGVPVIQQKMRRVVATGNPRFGGTIYKYLDAKDSTKYVDGTSAVADVNGSTGKQVYVEVPKYYIKKYTIGSQQFKLTALLPFEGSTTDPLFRKTGWSAGADGTDVLHESTHGYFSAFENVLYDASSVETVKLINGTGDADTTSLIDTVNDKLMSVSGYRPWAGITRAEARTLISNGGGKQFNIHQYNVLLDLFEIEYLTKNSQSILSGYTEKLTSGTYAGSVVRTGLTLSLGNGTGTITGKPSDFGGTDTGTLVIANSYRGIENPFGHLWQFVDGININNGIPYIIDFIDSTFLDDTATGNYSQAKDSNGNLIVLPTVSSQYISRQHDGTNYPKLLNGNTIANTGDYYYYDTGWRILRSGGNLTSGAQAGLSCWIGNDVSSNSNWHICGR